MRMIFLAVALIGMATTAMAQQQDNRGAGIRLHQPTGKELYVNPRQIAFIRVPLREKGEGGKAVVVFANGGIQPTSEDVKQIIDLIAAERFIIVPIPGECK